MKKISKIKGTLAPLDRINVDTDAIIPKQFLKSTSRSGFGKFLFDEWRYLDKGAIGQDCSIRPINPDFFLNQEPFNTANILLAGENFGCGSSREHAPWALIDYGFEAIIASSYGDIFYNNCLKNALLPVRLSDEAVKQIFELVHTNANTVIDIDVATKQVITAVGSYSFEIEVFDQKRLQEGLDDIGLTLKKADDIKQFEKNYHHRFPWLA